MTVKIIRFLISLVVRLTSRLRVHGLEKIIAMETGASIVASNHLGRLDAFMIYHLLPRDDLIVMAAEKYEKSAIARWVAKQFDAIFIDRYNADFRALREVLRRLQKGGMLVMAPEGTRSHTMALLKGQHGAAYLGAKTGVPIIPAAIVGSEDDKVYAFWKKLRRAPMDVYIGDPFTLPPLPKKNKEEAVEEYTSELMCRIAALLPPQYRGEYANHPRLLELLDGDLSKILKP